MLRTGRSCHRRRSTARSVAYSKRATRWPEAAEGSASTSAALSPPPPPSSDDEPLLVSRSSAPLPPPPPPPPPALAPPELRRRRRAADGEDTRGDAPPLLLPRRRPLPRGKSSTYVAPSRKQKAQPQSPSITDVEETPSRNQRRIVTMHHGGAHTHTDRGEETRRRRGHPHPVERQRRERAHLSCLAAPLLVWFDRAMRAARDGTLASVRRSTMGEEKARHGTRHEGLRSSADQPRQSAGRHLPPRRRRRRCRC